MSSKILVSVTLLILFLQGTSQYDESDIDACLNKSTGDHSCRYVLQWSLYERLRIHSVKSCLVFWDSVSQKLEHLWPRVTGSSESHFAGHGAPCNPETENKFYFELLNISRRTGDEVANLNIKNGESRINVSKDIDPSPNFFMEEFGRIFRDIFHEPTVRAEICDPRWLLVCQSSRTCGCVTPGLVQHAPHSELVKMGSIQRGLNLEKLHSKISEPDESYRCYPSHGSPCEVNLVFAGMCTTDCQWGQECYEGPADDDKYYRRCCSKDNTPGMKKNCTGKPSKKSAANTLSVSISLLAHLVILLWVSMSALGSC